MILGLALALIVALVLAFLLAFLLAMLAHEVRKKQAADAGAAQQSARNQELQDTMLLIASLLAFFTHFVAFFLARLQPELTSTPFLKSSRRPIRNWALRVREQPTGISVRP